MALKGDVVKEYCRKYRNTSSKELGVLLYKEQPLLFKDAENARGCVRYYRGAFGVRNRRKVSELIEKITLPESDAVSTAPYEISDFPVAICGDMHLPYHDVNAVRAFLDHAGEVGARTIVLCGDMLDAYQLSKWCKDPRKRSFPEEISMMKEFLQSIHNVFPDSRIVYKVGNHEERYENYVKIKAPELFGLDEVRLPNLLGIDKDASPWIDWVDDKRVLVAKKLHIIHGHEYVFSISNPVNPARGLYMRSKKSTMCFHFHQSSEHTETDIDGDIETCWSVGCLCGLTPEYMPMNKWCHGFADITLSDDIQDGWKVRNFRLFKGNVL